ncbi:MAG: UvrB/UvrC protein [uncultured bacterium]|nr:MAG: UvrB/UvrC protein [uncultured bacterium]
MKCIVCEEKEAVIHYAEVINGQIKKLDLCEDCAIKKGLGTQLSFSMGDMLGAMSETTEKDVSEKSVSVSCSKCSMTIEEFRKVGRLGCDKCYEAFEETLNSMLEQIHRSTHHKGKIPGHMISEDCKKENLIKLEQELQVAIESENFEKAAFLRDEIRKIKQNIS